MKALTVRMSDAHYLMIRKGSEMSPQQSINNFLIDAGIIEAAKRIEIKCPSKKLLDDDPTHN
jgi:uncharacterized protein (DUF1778 family)